MTEPSKEAMELALLMQERAEKQGKDFPQNGTELDKKVWYLQALEDERNWLALAIDALCAEQVKAETEKEREEWKTRFDDWRIPMADKIAALTAERNRYKAALEAILIYATVRGMDYEPSNIARAALEEVSHA